jgi:hypothetical protein
MEVPIVKLSKAFCSSLLAAACLLPATNAIAQSYDRPYGDRDYARRDRAVFDRVRVDLERAGSYPYSSRSDRKRFDEARRELFDFQSRFDQGRYDKHELNEAIHKIEDVVSHNSLDPRDRGALDDDLRRMRDYRQFRDHGGTYDYGYRR